MLSSSAESLSTREGVFKSMMRIGSKELGCYTLHEVETLLTPFKSPASARGSVTLCDACNGKIALARRWASKCPPPCAP